MSKWPDGIVGTGVKATPEECEQLSQPIIMIAPHGIPPMGFQERCHRAAMEHGLPDIKGSYGIDLSTGEFIKMAGQ